MTEEEGSFYKRSNTGKAKMEMPDIHTFYNVLSKNDTITRPQPPRRCDGENQCGETFVGIGEMFSTLGPT